MKDRDKLLNYGYRWVGMKLIDPSTACSLFGVKNIYKLYHDNTESLVETGTEEILSHSADGGLLGIEKTREEINNDICYLYNEVGDYSMLEYMYNYYENTNEFKIKNYINLMLELNDKMLDTEIYYEKREEFLTYLGFSWNNDSGLLEYKDKELGEDNFYYIVFVLGRDLLTKILPYETDTAYDLCKEIAKDFEQSEYNVNYKGLYECLERYVKDNFYLQSGEITWKGERLSERFVD